MIKNKKAPKVSKRVKKPRKRRKSILGIIDMFNREIRGR